MDHEYTAEDILAAIQRALAAGDMDAVVGLIKYLALVDPGAASQLVDGIQLGFALTPTETNDEH